MNASYLRPKGQRQGDSQGGALVAEYAVLLSAVFIFGWLALNSFQDTVAARLRSASLQLAELGGQTETSTRGGTGNCSEYYMRDGGCFCKVPEVVLSSDGPPVHSFYEVPISCEDMPPPPEDPHRSTPPGISQGDALTRTQTPPPRRAT